VQQLHAFGLSESASTELAATYPREYIQEKLTMAKTLIATRSKLIAQNPAGWLRKAMEEDYRPPRTAERHRQYHVGEGKDAKPCTRRYGTQDTTIAQTEIKEEYTPENVAATEHLPEQRSPQPVGEDGLTTEDTWNKALEKLQENLSPGEAETRLTGTTLLQVTETAAWISVPNRTALAWLERRLYGQICHAMKGVLGKDLDLQFVAAS
jgi:hypothetical protein